MREICREEEQVLGSIPRGGSDEKLGKSATLVGSTEQCSVEVAKASGDPPKGSVSASGLPSVGDSVFVAVGGVVKVHQVLAHSNEGIEGAVLVTTDGTKRIATLPSKEGTLWWRVFPGFWEVPASPAVDKPKRKRRTKAEMALTHGKNGVPELPAIHEKTPEKTPEALPVTDGESFGAHEGGDYEKVVVSLPPVRRCTGCDAFIGPEVSGAKCSYCTENTCDRVGCPAERAIGGGVYCRSHARAAAAAEVCPGETIARKVAAFLDNAYGEFYESLWQAASEDSSLDPVTVAVCKGIRDDERKVRR
jgi:hypothetical protein